MPKTLRPLPLATLAWCATPGWAASALALLGLPKRCTGRQTQSRQQNRQRLRGTASLLALGSLLGLHGGAQAMTAAGLEVSFSNLALKAGDLDKNDAFLPSITFAPNGSYGNGSLAQGAWHNAALFTFRQDGDNDLSDPGGGLFDIKTKQANAGSEASVESIKAEDGSTTLTLRSKAVGAFAGDLGQAQALFHLGPKRDSGGMEDGISFTLAPRSYATFSMTVSGMMMALAEEAHETSQARLEWGVELYAAGKPDVWDAAWKVEDQGFEVITSLSAEPHTFDKTYEYTLTNTGDTPMDGVLILHATAIAGARTFPLNTPTINMPLAAVPEPQGFALLLAGIAAAMAVSSVRTRQRPQA